MAKREQFPDRSGVYYTKPPVKIYVVGSAVAVSAFTLIVLALMFPWWFAAGGALVLAGALSWIGIAVLDIGASTYHKIAMQKYDRQRARYHTIPRTESIIDLLTGTIHAPAIGPGGPAQIVDGQAVEVERLRSVLDLLSVAEHFSIIGGTGSGKTTLANHIIDAIGGVVYVCDPDAKFNAWSSRAEIVGDGEDYEAIGRTIAGAELEMDQRYKIGPADHIPMALVIDESPAVFDNTPNALRLIGRIARRGRKVGIRLVLLSQTDFVRDLGDEWGSARLNLFRIGLEAELTKRNQATIKHWDGSKELIELCGPYHAHGGRWFSAARPALSLPQPVEVEPDAKLCAWCGDVEVSGKATYCSPKCRTAASRARNSVTDEPESA